MNTTWTSVQEQKLIELGVQPELLSQTFIDNVKRDQTFRKYEKILVRTNKENLLRLRTGSRRPLLCEVETKFITTLVQLGFVQVTTPIILSKNMLEKMTITSEHPLTKQVFWLDSNKCLRPMLAPNLYFLLSDLVRLWDKPVRIFEVGPCFRKESQGARHLNEFTMLNLVELGVPEGSQVARLKELGNSMMEAIDFQNYQFVTDTSDVYGETIDIVSNELELASGSYGPHSLDNKWGIFDNWVGIGIGLERVTMAMEGHRNIRRVGRSLSYLNGSRLNI